MSKNTKNVVNHKYQAEKDIPKPTGHIQCSMFALWTVWKEEVESGISQEAPWNDHTETNGVEKKKKTEAYTMLHCHSHNPLGSKRKKFKGKRKRDYSIHNSTAQV